MEWLSTYNVDIVLHYDPLVPYSLLYVRWYLLKTCQYGFVKDQKTKCALFSSEETHLSFFSLKCWYMASLNETCAKP